jgi:hypothetical protein
VSQILSILLTVESQVIPLFGHFLQTRPQLLNLFAAAWKNIRKQCKTCAQAHFCPTTIMGTIKKEGKEKKNK